MGKRAGYSFGEPVESGGLRLSKSFGDLRVEDGWFIGDRVDAGVNFPYELSILDTRENKTVFVEKGVGEIYRKGRGYYLRRETAFFFQIDGDTPTANRNNIPYDISLNKYDICFIKTDSPEDYRHLLHEDNSVIVAVDSFFPGSVQIQPDSLLGRTDGDIQNISSEDLWNILTKFTPSSKKLPDKPGSIRYNTIDECFEGFDGKRWRAIMWGEE